MRFLLDTHVTMGLAGDESDKVPVAIRDALESAEERVVSAASGMEIAMKTRLGKLPRGAAVIDRWAHIREAMLAQELPLTMAHMVRAGSLDWEHRDPFDRMLTAQAQLEDLTLVTSDHELRAFGGVRTAAW